MTKLDIYKLARGTVPYYKYYLGLPGDFDWQFSSEELTAYTRRVMEECAKACEQLDENGENPDCWDWHSKDYAAAIREMMP